MGVYKPCENCSGEVIVGVFDTITVPRLDDEGNVIPKKFIRLKLPAHRARVPHSEFRPTGKFNGNASGRVAKPL